MDKDCKEKSGRGGKLSEIGKRLPGEISDGLHKKTSSFSDLKLA